MKRHVWLTLLLGILAFSARSSAYALPPDHPSLASRGEDAASIVESDGGEDLEKLLDQAQELFLLRRPIDARAKLQKALKLAPRDYRPNMLLGAYYLSEVGHFRMAMNYLKTAEQIFRERYGTDDQISKDPALWRQHARLLYLLSEARLNLDNYKGALETLDRFSAHYWDDWYPGSRAWILMKLKRIDEAIEVAQAGLLRGAEPGRTYNILGILFSIKDNSQLALQAFSQAIRSELALGGSGQVATPLNNAGEVYREMFQDDLSEAAWTKAVSMPDGCDHILPSLNLAILYMDELRLFAAERVLNDFEACYAAQSLRSDTEHRGLLALARGRIALRMGDPQTAVKQLELATQREQWFGKIGTNLNDLRFAALIDLANALDAKAAALDDRASERPFSWVEKLVQKRFLALRAAWARRQARAVTIDELDDFEDLYIRHTDAMLEYPTLGRLLATFPLRSVSVRLEHLKTKDRRDQAALLYRLYLATALNSNGDYSEAETSLNKLRSALRPADRLARVEALVQYAEAKENARSWFKSRTAEELKEDQKLRAEIFALLPSALRYAGLKLPAAFGISVKSEDSKEHAEWIADRLENRFSRLDEGKNAPFRVEISEAAATPASLQIALIENYTGRVIASAAEALAKDGKGRANLVNKFVSKAFSHKVDPPSEPVAELELLEGLL